MVNKFLERNATLAQKETKRKQELTAKYGATTAQKIIDKKLEIGMSKAVCKEIIKEMYVTATVANKAATTETWKATHIITYAVSYLHFKGDKLVKIDNW